MKRSELSVGQHLYCSRPVDWKSRPYSGEEVIVVAVEPYQQAKHYAEYTQVPRGNGVLVKRAGLTDAKPLVVQLSSLRGDYAQIQAEQMERKRNADHAKADQEERRKAARQVQERIVKDAERLGLSVLTTYRYGKVSVEVPAADFEALLAGLPVGVSFFGGPEG